MKKELTKIANKYNCTITELEYVNNFEWRYYAISLNDKDGLHLDLYDFEYCVYDNGAREE